MNSQTRTRQKWLLALSLGSAVSLSGCGMVSRGDYRTLETQNRVLSEQNRAQQAELANLREHQRKLEDLVIRQGRTTDSLPSGNAQPLAR